MQADEEVGKIAMATPVLICTSLYPSIPPSSLESMPGLLHLGWILSAYKNVQQLF